MDEKGETQIHSPQEIVELGLSFLIWSDLGCEFQFGVIPQIFSHFAPVFLRLFECALAFVSGCHFVLRFVVAGST